MPERFLIEARNRTLAIENGLIADPAGRYDLVLRFPDADLRPGLINAHDHLHRNHYGRLGSPPYANARTWADDVQASHLHQIAAGRAVPRREALLAGAWKNLFAGVTTVVHHDRWEPDLEQGFPLRVLRIPHADSPALSRDPTRIDPRRRFCIHLAEGVEAASAAEVHELHAKGLLGPTCLAVHGVGMDEAGIALFRASGAALVWCPSSNLFLFHRTAAPHLLAEGVDVLLGSDSLLSGAGDLLDELRVARTTGLLDDERLEAAVGTVAARALGLIPARLGPGERADLIVLSQPLLDASVRAVELVVAGGVPRVAAPDRLPRALRDAGRLARIGGIARWIDPGAEKFPNSMNRLAPHPDLPLDDCLQAERG